MKENDSTNIRFGIFGLVLELLLMRFDQFKVISFLKLAIFLLICVIDSSAVHARCKSKTAMLEMIFFLRAMHTVSNSR